VSGIVAAADGLISARGLTKTYRMGEEEIHALDDVSLDIAAGEYVAVAGPSGSGKSTFMNLVGALDTATSGTLKVEGNDLARLRRDALAAFRSNVIGFVFQQFNLLPRTTALANVALPLLYSKDRPKDPMARARECLAAVGIADRASHMPSQLSGGQQQRVAIARALVNQPRIILADEPTGALDSKTAEEIMGIFEDLNRRGITIVLVTHEPDIAARARRRLAFRDGRIVSDTLQ
jgi:putative ABC transport system ATP-binding protein